MSQMLFSPDWLRKFTDPYAVLGVSVSADDRRILKRYRTVARLLHPDSLASADSSARELANQLLARFINPTYQKLKQETGRAEHVAMLRLRVRRMNKDGNFILHAESALQLLKTPLASADVFYEQAIATLAESQYEKLDQFEAITEELGELNLAYLRLKMGEIIREKQVGIVPVPAAGQSPVGQTIVKSSPTPTKTAPTAPSDYARRHYERAQEYIKKNNLAMAQQELRDAIKIEPTKSEYHSLLAKVYFMQSLTGMATVHFRQALKLNPQDPLALQYAQKLKINLDPPPTNQDKGNEKGGLFGLFAKKR